MATIFKGWRIGTVSDGQKYRFTFTPVDVVEVKTQTDNFASQVEIQIATLINLYDYKYYTNDNENFFEVTDIIYNKNYYTLFLQYIGNIDTRVAGDSRYYLRAMTAKNMQRLGFSVNRLIEIIGDELTLTKSPATKNDLFFAVKLDFKKLPQNLNYHFPTASDVQPTAYFDKNIAWDDMDLTGLQVKNCTSPTQTTITNVNEFVNGSEYYSVLLPIPKNNQNQNISIHGINKSRFNILLFLQALDLLITDLTVRASLIICNSYTIWGVGSSESEISVGAVTYIDNTLSIYPNEQYVSVVGVTDNINPAIADGMQPCLIGAFGRAVAGDSSRAGYALQNNYIEIPISKSSNNIAVALGIFNNIIDISKCKNTLYVQNINNSIRIWINEQVNDFIDIQNTMEFSKNSYSNFEAYKKANIELTQQQTNETLKVMQEQARTGQVLQIGQSLTNSVISAGGSVTSNGGFGVMHGVQALQTAGNVIFNQIRFDMQQQNERANLKLKQAHELELASCTIVPPQTLAGSIQINELIKSLISSNAMIVFYNIAFTEEQQLCVLNYVLENKILNTYSNTIPNYIADIPLWINFPSNIDYGKLYQMRFESSNVGKPVKSIILNVLWE